MFYSEKIRQAIRFSIKTHEVYKKQKRKGKDIAYITHPLTVGLILSLAWADEDVIAAGILHDTIEDSAEERKVTPAMLESRFGKRVAGIVASVSEENKKLPWEERKKEAIGHIASFSRDSLLVKSADVINNVAELAEDYRRRGDEIFGNFNAPKDKILWHYCAVIEALMSKWPDNPLSGDLIRAEKELSEIGEE